MTALPLVKNLALSLSLISSFHQKNCITEGLSKIRQQTPKTDFGKDFQSKRHTQLAGWGAPGCPVKMAGMPLLLSYQKNRTPQHNHNSFPLG